jgi:hypothetical protein
VDVRLASGWLAAVCALLAFATHAHAQTPPGQTTTGPGQGPRLIRVHLACTGCDVAGLKSDVAFVEYVAEPGEAVVDVAIASEPDTAGGRLWRATFTGRGEFEGQSRTLTATLAANIAAAELRSQLARLLRFGLAEYAHRSDAGAHLDVTMRSAEETSAGAAGQPRDPWNYWVYRLSVNGYQSGETTSANSSYSGSASASRTTEDWKLRFSAYRSSNSSRFDLSDTVSIQTNESDWSVDALVVRSLNGHWSAGLTGSASSSTYSNLKLRVSAVPAIEFDVFPYSESSKRSLTIQYSIGPNYYEYRQLTIFDKLQETVVRQSVTASLGLRQPWGSVGGSASFSQLIPDVSKNRVSVFGNMSVRLFRGFSINGSASFSRIRDQFQLEKADATPEEILLRLRQLATGYSYSASFGFSYSFGSLSNATVNPRFGG